VADFRAALAELAADDDLRAVIVRGSGTRAFCAGADLVERTTLSAEERVAHLEAIWALCEELVAVPVPVIASIRGFCLAAVVRWRWRATSGWRPRMRSSASRRWGSGSSPGRVG
jgi:enoyl-CoA hydratase/carnithine racemase